MEFWDAYDINFNLIKGKTLVRGEEIPDGLYHLVCEILVKHSDSTYLLMQRDISKHFGGFWEATAGGSALQGETPIECAIRELKEETGIFEDDLIEIGRVIHHQRHTIYVEYLAITNWDKSNVILQEGETQNYKWVSANTLKAMSSDELVTNRMQIFDTDIQP